MKLKDMLITGTETTGKCHLCKRENMKGATCYKGDIVIVICWGCLKKSINEIFKDSN